MAAPALATVLVVTGEAGVATRTDLTRAPAEFRGQIIDDWTIRPTDGPPVNLVVVKPPAGPYMLTINQMSDTDAVVFLLVESLNVHTGQQAREAARHLVRAVVHGTLPAAPTSDVDHAQWETCIPVVARIVARTWPDVQPRGR